VPRAVEEQVVANASATLAGEDRTRDERPAGATLGDEFAKYRCAFGPADARPPRPSARRSAA
jgi:hypothetical protein